MVAALLVILAWLVFSGLSNALVYYLTPTELAARATPPLPRSGWAGWSCPAAWSGSATDLTFVLTDGDTEITVHSTWRPPARSGRAPGPWSRGAPPRRRVRG